MATRRPQRRRGALLLIVLSLLVLFMLVGVSFIVSASRFRDLAEANAKTGTTGIDGIQIANNTINQILHGSKNPTSKIRGHSLLEDLYGRDYFVGRATNDAASATGMDNQLQEFTFDFVRVGDVPQSQLRDDYYGGCVMTFISGRAKGKSVRVYKYFNNTSIRAIRFIGVMDGTKASPTLAVASGDLFIVNGRPFNGTGAGYTTNASQFTPLNGAWKLNNVVTMSPTPDDSYQVPVALMPNYSAYQFPDEISPPLRGHASFEEIAFGGQDETYDAVDFQNMAMAKVPTRPNHNAQVGRELLEAEPDDLEDLASARFLSNTGGIIPSFHRPYLLRYIQRNYPGLVQHPLLKRPFLFRPDSADHPNFTGSNPAYDPLVGPWDVDNDGDGFPDSVFVDMGHDPITGPDGKLYKPLIAALILDMDGRLNLNTIGGLDQHGARAVTQERLINNAAGPATQQQSVGLSLVGMGYGPADIDASTSFGSAAMYRSILHARYAGVNEMPITVSSINSETSNVPGEITVNSVDDDTRDLVYELPGNALAPSRYALRAGQNSLTNGYGSPADLKGRAVPFIGPFGNTMWANAGVLDSIDDPYEFDPLNPSSRDSPFSVEDLDFLLRFEDRRAQSTLREINDVFSASGVPPFELYDNSSFDGSTVDEGRRRRFTTHSVHVPALPGINPGQWRHLNASRMPSSLANGGGRPVRGDGLTRGIREMFAAKIRRVHEADGTPISAEQAFEFAGRMMPPEFERGEKLDINQALLPGTTDAQKRQFATYLFHLMMLLGRDEMVQPQLTPIITGVQSRELQVRRIAQWAINVVDFGDADSAMTLFEYDIDPFNAITVNNGNPDPLINPPGEEVEARRIWGCEHPELVLSETMAFHDRRVEDLAVGGDRLNDDGTQVDDDDLDQQVLPQGAAFIELLCVRGASQVNGATNSSGRFASERGPEDLYGKFQASGDLNSDAMEFQRRYMPTLNLAQLAPNGAPVWRIAISERETDSNINGTPIERRKLESTPASFDPNDFSLLQRDAARMELTRFFWFAAPPAGTPPGNNVFFTDRFNFNADSPQKRDKLAALSLTSNGPVVEPGTYIVIGPEDTQGSGVTRIGEKKGGTDSAQTINLTNLAHAKADGSPLRTVGVDRSLPNPTRINAPSVPSRAVNIVARNQEGNGLNISEPVNGYPELAAPRDTPLDSPATVARAEDAPLWYTPPGDNVPDEENMQLVSGHRTNFRTVFLQRLANPSQPFDPNLNPYMTVDWMPIDLSVFNSRDEEPSNWNLNEPFDPQDPLNNQGDGLAGNAFVPSNLVPFRLTAPDPTKPNERFPHPGYLTSREKAGFDLNIWSSQTAVSRAVPLRLVGTNGPTLSNEYVDEVVQASHTLGWLNRSFDYVGDPTIGVSDGLNIGYLNGDGSLHRWFPNSNNPQARQPRPDDEFVALGDGEGHFILPGLPFAEAPNTRTKAGTKNGGFEVRADGTLVWNQVLPHMTMVSDHVPPMKRVVTPVTQGTFPTLAWNNRPYISEYELMLVPACGQSRLSHEFTISQSVMLPGGIPARTPPTDNGPYLNNGQLVPQPLTGPIPPAGNGAAVAQNRLNIYRGAFGHLLNFFNSTTSSPEEGNQAGFTAGNYYHIFDYVGVPSRFRGTQQWFNTQSSWQTHATKPLRVSMSTDRGYSTFREPGRVNLNTAYDSSIWFSLLGPVALNGVVAPFEAAMAGGLPSETQKQVGGVNVDFPRTPTGDFPSEYPSPYRMAAAADLIPPLINPDTGAVRQQVPFGNDPFLGVNATLLRTGTTAFPFQPALAPFGFEDDRTNPAQATRKNAYFRYRHIQKIANSVTSQSNVYAVWITVAYFEIEPNYPITAINDDAPVENDFTRPSVEYDFTKPFHVDEAHPDGYRFGTEMGSELGNVVRHRSFYILDRSVPVAFEPGVNHNTDNAILLRRHLE